MAKTSKIVKDVSNRVKYEGRLVNRCSKCGRPRAFIRFFSLCRICFRNNAHEGLLPGVTKASW